MINALHNVVTVLYVSGANRALWTQSLWFTWHCASASLILDDRRQAPEGKQVTCSAHFKVTGLYFTGKESTNHPWPSCLLKEIRLEPLTDTAKLLLISDPELRIKNSAPVFQLNPPQSGNLPFPWRLLPLWLPDLCFAQKVKPAK